MSEFAIFAGWFVIFVSGSILWTVFRWVQKYRKNLRAHGVKTVPLLPAHFIVGGAWCVALLLGISMVVWGWNN
jgi:hypothetical protein